jgi:hypothetical protein
MAPYNKAWCTLATARCPCMLQRCVVFTLSESCVLHGFLSPSITCTIHVDVQDVPCLIVFGCGTSTGTSTSTGNITGTSSGTSSTTNTLVLLALLPELVLVLVLIPVLVLVPLTATGTRTRTNTTANTSACASISTSASKLSKAMLVDVQKRCLSI